MNQYLRVSEHSCAYFLPNIFNTGNEAVAHFLAHLSTPCHLLPPPPSFHRPPAFAPCLRWLAVKHDVCALTRFCCRSTSGMRSDWALGWHMPRSRHFSIMSSVAVSAPCSPTACFFFFFNFLFECVPSFRVPTRLRCFLVASDIKERSLAVRPCAFSHHTWLSSSFVPHGYFQPCSLGFLSSFSSSSSSSDVPHFQTISLSWLSCSVKSLATMLWVGNTHRNTSPREVRWSLLSVGPGSGSGGLELEGKGHCWRHFSTSACSGQQKQGRL